MLLWAAHILTNTYSDYRALMKKPIQKCWNIAWVSDLIVHMDICHLNILFNDIFEAAHQLGKEKHVQQWKHPHAFTSDRSLLFGGNLLPHWWNGMIS